MMKKVFTVLFFIGLFKTSAAQSKIVVNITNVENNKGVCKACVFASADSFSGSGTPVKCTQATINNKSAQLIFEGIPEGDYAVSVFHDANNNNKMDKNFLGIPKEGYGASKNKLPFASAPRFNENKFSVKNHTINSLAIKLRYL
jgi:uncharacterized protein (DUF2141 family)